ncbi:hypothetical protein BASA50_010510 [Batrachochytrium salamandrivorans]|uniref:Uncharacterized protein n=1 Tax=Batrachochytrium salamandrivorans TaxID=1357716 RepID=A0ABQ8EY59_9FUNG|nr:hypothetical protein BASA62_009276 [Batrachochytrium salamandrivorans]KAH6568302.1 hypothetical protein BASA60_008713 [Batrachochytrium salamandrivorans]KAH6588709.1 hypothetical protein BASA50_010510 [Batrachochytrium salamandrivorans]KAH6602884.1 hypothetical protein BASA61_000661 [Batrachochytrium salamandrivorans]KAH9272554.1 hypothetical protein BASA83_005054 [Batrachochytrium salamandrivorans]
MASLSLASNDSSCRPIHRRPSLLSQRSLSIHPIGKSEPKPVMNLELNTSSDSLKSISCRSTLLIPGHSRLAKEVNLSPNTQCLLKGMMRSAKLTYSQQRCLDSLVRDHGSLPSRPMDAMHAQDNLACTALPETSQRYGQPQTGRQNTRTTEWLEWRSKPGLRTLDQIKRSGMYAPELFRPTPMKDMSVEKGVFQDRLEGKDRASDSLDRHTRSHRTNHHEQQAESRSLDPSPIDEFEMVQGEINERRQWIDDMVSLGRGMQYKRQIQNEISQRVSRLEQIHKERMKSTRMA